MLDALQKKLRKVIGRNPKKVYSSFCYCGHCVPLFFLGRGPFVVVCMSCGGGPELPVKFPGIRKYMGSSVVVKDSLVRLP